MLVITRREGEALRIGPDIRIEVREIRSREVKLTISAPAEMTILRAEIGSDSSRHASGDASGAASPDSGENAGQGEGGHSHAG
ncbi:MAG: carbon storage regulator [Candidatus Eisenbacteria sp.]|nr:carbon storage regulator [Candidatus Eisenbacteria bacterium]